MENNHQAGSYTSLWHHQAKRWRKLLLLILLMLLPLPVSAHGEDRTLQHHHVLVGPYRLTVWTAPATLRTGEIHVATTLYTADGRLAQNGIIQVTFTRLERQDPPLSALVYRAPNGPVGMGEATFRIEKPGTYQVALTVSNDAGTQGTVDFDVEIVRVSPLIKVSIYSLLVGTVVAGAWMVWQGMGLWFAGKSGIVTYNLERENHQ